MGKLNRQSHKHSNHHDNPQKQKSAVKRRQHSQLSDHKPKTKPLSKAQNGRQRPRANVPFNKHDNVLLVGEGDFSFTLSLTQRHKPDTVLATCYDTQQVLEEKYPHVKQVIAKLHRRSDEAHSGSVETITSASLDRISDIEWAGFSPPPPPSAAESDTSERVDPDRDARLKSKCAILYGIDATKLCSIHKRTLRPFSPFTKIVFNFPHVGGLSTDVNRQVRSNQQMLVGFFHSAKVLLSSPNNPCKMATKKDTTTYDSDELYWSDDASAAGHERSVKGQILVTLFESEPYTLWNIRDLARHCGLQVVESFKFPWAAYPGYHHARTTGDIITGKDRDGQRKGAWRGEERDARCYVLETSMDAGETLTETQGTINNKKRGSSSASEDDNP